MGDEVPAEVGQDPNAQNEAAENAALLLRAKNIKEFHSILSTAGTLTFPNGVAIDSGLVVTFKGKGLFDGNWIIQKYTIHLTDGKLEAELEFRKCLIIPPGVVKKSVTQSSADDFNPLDPFEPGGTFGFEEPAVPGD